LTFANKKVIGSGHCWLESCAPAEGLEVFGWKELKWVPVEEFKSCWLEVEADSHGLGINSASVHEIKFKQAPKTL